ncbi:MAG: hypothetical protein IJ997_00615 [Mycoplasmataceae bacterium]|nr:hypothetical protein [Mycoplasmataceae bacterium]
METPDINNRIVTDMPPSHFFNPTNDNTISPSLNENDDIEQTIDNVPTNQMKPINFTINNPFPNIGQNNQNIQVEDENYDFPDSDLIEEEEVKLDTNSELERMFPMVNNTQEFTEEINSQLDNLKNAMNNFTSQNTQGMSSRESQSTYQPEQRSSKRSLPAPQPIPQPNEEWIQQPLPQSEEYESSSRRSQTTSQPTEQISSRRSQTTSQPTEQISSRRSQSLPIQQPIPQSTEQRPSRRYLPPSQPAYYQPIPQQTIQQPLPFPQPIPQQTIQQPLPFPQPIPQQIQQSLPPINNNNSGDKLTNNIRNINGTPYRKGSNSKFDPYFIWDGSFEYFNCTSLTKNKFGKWNLDKGEINQYFNGNLNENNIQVYRVTNDPVPIGFAATKSGSDKKMWEHAYNNNPEFKKFVDEHNDNVIEYYINQGFSNIRDICNEKINEYTSDENCKRNNETRGLNKDGKACYNKFPAKEGFAKQVISTNPCKVKYININDPNNTFIEEEEPVNIDNAVKRKRESINNKMHQIAMNIPSDQGEFEEYNEEDNESEEEYDPVENEVPQTMRVPQTMNTGVDKYDIKKKDIMNTIINNLPYRPDIVEGEDYEEYEDEEEEVPQTMNTRVPQEMRIPQTMNTGVDKYDIKKKDIMDTVRKNIPSRPDIEEEDDEEYDDEYEDENEYDIPPPPKNYDMNRKIQLTNTPIILKKKSDITSETPAKPIPTPIKSTPTPIKSTPTPIKSIPATPDMTIPTPIKSIPTPDMTTPTPIETSAKKSVKPTPTPIETPVKKSIKSIPTPIKSIPTPDMTIPTPIETSAKKSIKSIPTPDMTIPTPIETSAKKSVKSIPTPIETSVKKSVKSIPATPVKPIPTTPMKKSHSRSVKLDISNIGESDKVISSHRESSIKSSKFRPVSSVNERVSSVSEGVSSGSKRVAFYPENVNPIRRPARKYATINRDGTVGDLLKDDQDCIDKYEIIRQFLIDTDTHIVKNKKSK